MEGLNPQFEGGVAQSCHLSLPPCPSHVALQKNSKSRKRHPLGFSEAKSAVTTGDGSLGARMFPFLLGRRIYGLCLILSVVLSHLH